MAKIYGLNAAVDLAANKQIAFNSLFSRGNGQPLDSTQLWYPKDGKTGYERAVEYAKTNAAYVGQELGVVNVIYEKDGTTVKSTFVTFYGVQDANGTLKEIGSVPVGDDLSIEVVDEKIQIKGFGDHYYAVFTATNIYPSQAYIDKDFSNAANVSAIFIDDAENGQYLRGANNTWAVFENDGTSDGYWRQATDYEVAAIRNTSGEERVEGFIEGLEPRVRSNDNHELEIAWYKPSETTVEGVNSALQTLTTKVNMISTEVDVIEKVVGDREDELANSDDPESKVDTIWANINSHESRIDNIENDYLKAKDKTELDNKITSVANRTTALENKVDTGDKTVTEYIAEQIGDIEEEANVATYVGKKITEAALGKLTKVIADSVNIETNKVIIDEVETDPADSVIYMVRVDKATGDVYKEYMLINSVLVQTGDTTTDLSNYYTKDVIDDKFKDIEDKIPLDLGVMSVGVGTSLENQGTNADPVLDLKLAKEQGNVTLDKTDGLKASIDLSGYATRQFVGDIPTDAEATTVIGYINEKAQEVLDAATGGSSESAASVKQQLDTYKAANDPKVSALLAEVYGPLAEGQTAYDYDADSRIDALEKADAAHDILIANNTTLAQKGVDDAKTANDAIAALISGRITTIETNVTNLQTTTDSHGTTISNHETRVAAIEQTIKDGGALDLRIDTLEAFQKTQTELNLTVNQTINTKLPGDIAKKLDASEISKYSTTDAMNTAIENATKDKLVAADLADYAKTEDLKDYVHDNYATITELQAIYSTSNEYNTPTGVLADEIERAKAAEKKNADAIATLNGNDTGKSVRTIAAEELAAQLIPESAKESLDTLTEIAAWIQEHPEDAAEMNAKITAHDTILAGIGGTDQPATVIAAIQDAVDNLEPLAVATATKLGGVISAQDSVVEGATVTAANAVYVAADTGAMSVKKVTTDILVNGANELILFGGNAQATVTE